MNENKKTAAGTAEELLAAGLTAPEEGPCSAEFAQGCLIGGDQDETTAQSS